MALEGAVKILLRRGNKILLEWRFKVLIMFWPMIRLSIRWFSRILARPGTVALCGVLALALSLTAFAQQPEQTQPPAPPSTAQTQGQTPAQTPNTSGDAQTPAAAANPSPAQAPAPDAVQQQAPAATQPAATPSTESQPAAQQPAATPETPQSAPAAAPAATTGPAVTAKPEPPKPAEITEEDLKKLLVGKELYLRGGYLENTLSFNEHGALIGHSPQGSYTLCAVKIDRVRLTKHKVELEGERYGLHFLGALASEDPSKAVDRVNITPKKKVLRITVDRELLVAPKKEGGMWPFGKTAKPAAAAKPPAAGAKPASTPAQPAAAAATAPPATAAAPAPPAAAAAPAATSVPPAAEPNEPSEAEQIKAEIAAAPPAERPADPGSLTRTISPEHATKVLKDALDHIFAQGIDAQLLASMPPFWRLYYQAVEDKSDYRPADPAVQRQNMVDQKARLLTFSEPASNEYAQASGVAGMALYHTVVGADGKAGEIAVGRPIGFGLDENAVEAIRKATFEPAIRDGKPVPVLLNLVVQFRIYSKKTAEAAKPGQKGQPEEPSLPGPYSRQEQP
jgi:hypothetical protein